MGAYRERNERPTREHEAELEEQRRRENELAKQVFERDAYRCRRCGGHIDLTVDHIVPEARGGASTLDNLQTLCRPCNSRKGKS